MSRCLSSARMNMLVDVQKPAGSPNSPTGTGTWVTQQDPGSGAIIRVFVPDDTTTPEIVEGGGLRGVRALVRGVIDGGIRVAGTTERFAEVYENVDWARMTFPANVNITKRDRITNVRTLGGLILWREEEMDNAPATVFNVMGVTPVINPFGKHSENVALLQRAEVQ